MKFRMLPCEKTKRFTSHTMPNQGHNQVLNVIFQLLIGGAIFKNNFQTNQVRRFGRSRNQIQSDAQDLYNLRHVDHQICCPQYQLVGLVPLIFHHVFLQHIEVQDCAYLYF